MTSTPRDLFEVFPQNAAHICHSGVCPLFSWAAMVLTLDLSPLLQVQPAKLLAAGAPQPWQAALLGCLWVAAKLEERRRGLPSASKVRFSLTDVSFACCHLDLSPKVNLAMSLAMLLEGQC